MMLLVKETFTARICLLFWPYYILSNWLLKLSTVILSLIILCASSHWLLYSMWAKRMTRQAPWKWQDFVVLLCRDTFSILIPLFDVNGTYSVISQQGKQWPSKWGILKAKVIYRIPQASKTHFNLIQCFSLLNYLILIYLKLHETILKCNYFPLAL